MKDPECAREYSRRYRAKHPEKVAQGLKDWRKRNLAKRNEYMAKYREENADKIAKARFRDRIRKYGITTADYWRMYAFQRGRCAICRETSATPLLHVDHDHKTGQVRGLLCEKCNLGLGQFRDNPLFLTAAIKYLEVCHGHGPQAR